MSEIELKYRLIESDCKLIEKYTFNNRIKLKLNCNKDNHTWDVFYYSFVNNKTGCPRCAGQIKYNTEINKNINNRLIEIDAKLNDIFIYKNCYSKLEIKCNKDNHIWSVSYTNFVNSETGCPKCSGKIKLSQEIAEKNILERCKEINCTLLDKVDYKNNKTRFKLKCNKDNHIWETTYYNFVNSKKGCPKCKGNLKLTQEQAEEKVFNRCKIMNYNLLNSFNYTTNSKTVLKLKCNKDNHIWNPTYYNFINKNSNCPKCNSSKGELRIESFLKDNKLEYKTQKIFKDCKNIGYLKFDFYIPKYNTCIEFDGIQHFKSFNFFGGIKKLNENIKRDNIKKLYCKNNNITLIRIPYYEINNIENILKCM